MAVTLASLPIPDPRPHRRFRENFLGQLFGSHNSEPTRPRTPPVRDQSEAAPALSVVGALSPAKLLLRGGEAQRIKARLEGSPVPKLFEAYLRSP